MGGNVSSGQGGATGTGGEAQGGRAQGGGAQGGEAGESESGGAGGSMQDPDEIVAASTNLVSTCALSADGRVRCWGYGYMGALGYGNKANVGDDETPASIGDVDVGGPVRQIAAGAYHTCALFAGGRVRCWGWGLVGGLGYGNVGDDELPTSVGFVDIGGNVVQIAAGTTHTCALLEGGKVRCWGSGSFGQLGYGNTDNIGDNQTPASAGDVDVGGSVEQIVAGTGQTCALLTGGKVRCWGKASAGQLGYGNTEDIGDDETPASVGDVDVGGPVTQITLMKDHACALLENGAVRCWGSNDRGCLGYGNTDNIGDDETPASAGDVDVGGVVVRISAGGSQSCALLASGAVRCWGSGSAGVLGHLNTDDIGDDEAPASAGDIDVGGVPSDLVSGDSHACVILAGKLRCWGKASAGQLGYGNTENIGDDESPASAGDVPAF